MVVFMRTSLSIHNLIERRFAVKWSFGSQSCQCNLLQWQYFQEPGPRTILCNGRSAGVVPPAALFHQEDGNSYALFRREFAAGGTPALRESVVGEISKPGSGEEDFLLRGFIYCELRRDFAAVQNENPIAQGQDFGEITGDK